MSRARGQRGAVALLFAVLACATVVAADVEHPVVHELIPPDDQEDMKFSVTTVDGDLAAAIETSSGVVRAPDTQSKASGSSAYREPPSSPDAVFKPDRDTRRPSMVRYEDPFVPSVTPYKRLRAYDMVAADRTLRVRDPGLSRVALGGDVRADEDQFYGQFSLDFDASPTVLIPPVAPGSRLLRQHTTPEVPVEVFRDGADNWYARAPASVKGKVRLVVQVAAPRRAFAGPLNMPPGAVLPTVPALSPNLARAVDRVLRAIGISHATPPAEAVQKMVGYFRGFSASDDPPHGEADVYLDLALSRKGVCRHRAFAFLVTALGLGIPSRMVVNEAHAWVEVRSLDLWQRIDLGGAASNIEESLAQNTTAYQPPSDPFAWPAASDESSGRQAAARGRQALASSARAESASSPADDRQSSAARAEPSSAARAEPSAAAPAERRESDRPRARVTLDSGDVRVRRGAPLALRGRVSADDGAPCASARVDVVLSPASGASRELGVLGTDQAGAFSGELVVPLGLPVGDYDVLVRAAESERCGAGSSDR